MENITLNCDSVYNKILNYYVERYKKESKEVDILNLEIRCFIENKLTDKYRVLNKKAFLKKEKKEKRKFFLSSVINMPFICPVLVTIPILDSDETHRIRLYDNDIKSILKHYYKDSIIEIEYYTLKEILDNNEHLDSMRPFRNIIISKNVKEIESHKPLRKTK